LVTYNILTEFIFRSHDPCLAQAASSAGVAEQKQAKMYRATVLRSGAGDGAPVETVDPKSEIGVAIAQGSPPAGRCLYLFRSYRK
jgi:hypothetical protein